MIIGITGGTGCGKSTVCEVLASYGYTVIDCDQIYHRLLTRDKKLLDAIRHRFPDAVTDGKLDRKRLGQTVFSDPQALADLNRITHSAVCAEVRRLLAQKPENAVIDAVALCESGLDSLCDLTVAVSAPESLRIRRLTQRDGISEEYARLRIGAQALPEVFESRCDRTLYNDAPNGDLFREKCVAFFSGLGIMKEEL